MTEADVRLARCGGRWGTVGAPRALWGLVVTLVVIAPTPTVALSRTEFDPAVGAVTGAREPLRVGERFHQQNRMAVAL